MNKQVKNRAGPTPYICKQYHKRGVSESYPQEFKLYVHFLIVLIVRTRELTFSHCFTKILLFRSLSE